LFLNYFKTKNKLDKLISLFLILLLVGCSKKKDSINNDFVEIDKLISLSQNENRTKFEKISFADSVFQRLKPKKNDSILRTKYFSLANSYFTLYELEKYKEVSELVLEFSEREKDTLNIAKAQLYIGDYYFEKTQNDSAFVFYRNAEELFSRINDNKNLAKVILYKAYILLYEKDFLGSETATIKALSLYEKDEVFKYECYVNLGSSLSGLENYEKALEYHEKSLIQCEKLRKDSFYEVFKAQSYNNIGMLYLKQENYKEAESNFKKGLEINDIEKRHSLIYASLLDNLAYSKFKLKDETSYKYFLDALQVRDSVKNSSGIIKSKIHLAEYFFDKKDRKKALKLNKEAYSLAKKSKFHEDVLKSLELFNKMDPFNGALYSREYIQLSDSLYKVERETRNKLARIEFETDEIIQEKEVLSEQRKLILVVSFILISFSVLLYIILYQRSKQKELVFTQEQQSANEEIYKLMINQQLKVDEVRNAEKNRIAKELHDGIMNKLTSTRLNLFVLTKRRDDETIQKCINYIDDIQNIEKEVRSIAHELSNDIFTQKNSFKNILTELIKDQNKLFPAKCELELDKKIKWEKIDVSIKMNLYRIIQEALNNCNKYAKATNINIQIHKEASDKITLSIIDDGVGFKLNKKKNGIGMKNMSERAESIDGTFKIYSEINKGTKILIEFQAI
jgi:signal transduction histidine kinase